VSGKYIEVYVHPRARQRRIELRGDNRYEVWVPEAPADGATNKAVQRLLAEALTVAPSRLVLIRGHTSRKKVFQLMSA
jgi:uncharacterized protein YggU (UPF0235/DUF167 family)